MVVESYAPETFISGHTNKPICSATKNQLPVFWCDICQLRLKTIHTAIQHLGGRLHKARIVAKNNPAKQGIQTDVSKRKHDSNLGEEPAVKKLKDEATSEVNIKCEDCNIEFGARCLMAIQHFKGKKHAAKIASKLTSKPNQMANTWAGGRGGSRQFPIQFEVQRGGQRGRPRGARQFPRGGQRGGPRGGGGGGGGERGDGFKRVHTDNTINKSGRFDEHYATNRNTNLRNGSKSLLDVDTHKSDSHPLKNIYRNPLNNRSVNSFRNNSDAGKMNWNEARSEKFDDFYGNLSSSNFESPRYESNDHLKHKDYFAPVVAQKDTFSSRPPKDVYNDNIEMASNSYYDRPSLLDAPKDNFNGGNYYSKDYGHDSNDAYRSNSGNNLSTSFGINNTPKDGYEMKNDSRYNLFINETY